MMFSRKKSEDEGSGEGERKVKLSRRGNPSTRPMLTRIYGMLGCLAVTLFFIGLLVFLEKTLPDGSKSQFHPTWRRDNSLEPRIKAEVGERGLVFLPATVTSAAPISTAAPARALFTLAPVFNPSLIFALPCVTTQTDCSTVNVPGKLRARYNEVQCSTYTETVACSPSPTPTPTPTAAHFSLITFNPILFNPSLFASSCSSTEVTCSTVNVPGKLRLRYNQVECTTLTETFACPTTPTPTSVPTTSSVSITSAPIITSSPSSSTSVSVDPCVTSFEECSDSVCFTYYSTAASCEATTTSSPPIITSPPSSSTSVSVDPCITSFEECSDSVCFTQYSTLSGCGVTSTSSPPIITPTSSVDPCLTSAVYCTNVEAPTPDCFTEFYRLSQCEITSSSSSPTIPSPPISSTAPPSSSVDPCVTPIVSCPDIIFKRQSPTDCVTSYSTASSCISSSSPPLNVARSTASPRLLPLRVVYLRQTLHQSRQPRVSILA
ncbi:hypothetical protein BDZ45DRAFT_750539 [Acephala macrosclerotiorum]|nr:hypothetical protein BDZ45DRAFT_750539 [Acephala macrosclerotiorum]